MCQYLIFGVHVKISLCSCTKRSKYIFMNPKISPCTPLIPKLTEIAIHPTALFAFWNAKHPHIQTQNPKIRASSPTFCIHSPKCAQLSPNAVNNSHIQTSNLSPKHASDSARHNSASFADLWRLIQTSVPCIRRIWIRAMTRDSVLSSRGVFLFVRWPRCGW